MEGAPTGVPWRRRALALGALAVAASVMAVVPLASGDERGGRAETQCPRPPGPPDEVMFEHRVEPGDDGPRETGPGDVEPAPRGAPTFRRRVPDGDGCHGVLALEVRGEPGEAVDPPDERQMRRHLECLRKHGLELGEPEVDEHGFRVELPEGFDPTSEEVREAHEACDHLLPAPPAPPGEDR